MKTKTRKRKIIQAVVVTAIVVVVALIIVLLAGKWFTHQESVVRTAWQVDVGDLLGKDETYELEIQKAAVTADLSVIQLVPFEVDAEGFTYYDTAVQERLAEALGRAKQLKRDGDSWGADAPLAVLNPFGTASNALYLYFETEFPTQVSYTIHVDKEEIPDYTATASNPNGEAFCKEHEFQLIGLVPGETNEVTMTIRGSWGNIRQKVSFSITMPETHSGYATKLDYTDGESSAALSDGLFAMMRTNGYLGYGFFFDNSGILRYEMVLEGYGLDRMLTYGEDMVTCVSSTKLAKINPLGQVEQTYSLDGYELHHDINYCGENTLVALVEREGDVNVEDIVIEVNLETGEVTELIDYKELMAEYYAETRPISVIDDFFWQAGERDWIHLNTIQYVEENDSLIVSSRETSTIIKAEQIHTTPTLTWLAGDPAFWEGTAYEDLCLTPEGDFVFQYGQHSVEYAGAGEEDGTYYLRLFNNNYWSLNTRDYSPKLDSSVGTGLYGGAHDHSSVYLYKIDENNRTFSLADSFTVPYSSIVSNVSPIGESGNYVVNSGMEHVYGEYDADGMLIRSFEYDCNMQGYRTFKSDFKGYWFQ